jgi:DNA-3-methyladenine glycosylase I
VAGVALPANDGLIVGEDGKARCFWGAGPTEYTAYHDREWGRPTANDHRLFEKICLEGFQAGLSWLTILRKRENFRAAFAGFDFARVARFGEKDIDRLMQDAGIVRHRGKIASVVNNARQALALADEAGSLAAFVWGFEPRPGSRPARTNVATLAAASPSKEAAALSKELKKRGWSFVGPTTVYAFMQAMGLVNDHLDGCHCRAEVEAERHSFKRPKISR